MALSTIQNNSFADTAVHGYRNLIINGAMQVAQRGVGPTSVTPYEYNTADRMRFSSSGGTLGTWTQEVVTDQDVGDFVGNALKSTCSVAGSGGNVSGLNIRLELDDVKKYVGQNMTLSYYAKSDAPVTLTPMVFADVNINMGTDTFTSSYIRYTHTFTLTSLSTKTFFDLVLRVDGEIATTHYITGVQLEVGSEATPFEHRPYADELRRCQRYYQTSFLNTTVPTATVTNQVIYYPDATTSYAQESVYFPVEMRAAPACTIYSGLSTTANRIANRDNNTTEYTASGSGRTGGIFVTVAGQSVGQSTGLGFHYVAKSEL